MAARDPDARREIARLGGLARSARQTPSDMLAKANRTYRDSFRQGHKCGMCSEVLIPQDLPAEEIQRRADALFRLHMSRLRMRQARAKSKQAEAAAELKMIDGELAHIASAS